MTPDRNGSKPLSVAYIKFNCPHCQEPIEAPKDSVGTTGKCPYCQNDITIPDTQMEEAQVAEIPLKPTAGFQSGQKRMGYQRPPLEASSRTQKSVRVVSANPQTLKFTCQHCGHSLKAPANMVGGSVECPNCGNQTKVRRKVSSATIGMAHTLSEVGRPSPQENQPPKKTSNNAAVGCLAIVVTILTVCTFLSRCNTNSTQHGQPDAPDAVGAWVACRGFVEDRLKAPGTAKWPWSYTEHVTDLGGGRYRIVAYVDSQNSFGAMLRTDFTAVVKWVGNDSWQLESFQPMERQ